MGEKENFDPCKIETLEHIIPKFVIFHYVSETGPPQTVW